MQIKKKQKNTKIIHWFSEPLPMLIAVVCIVIFSHPFPMPHKNTDPINFVVGYEP